MLKTSKLLKIIGAACLSVGAISVCALAANHSKTPVVEETEAADYYASITDDLEGQDLIDALHTLNASNKTTTVGYDGMRPYFQYVDTCASAGGKIVGFYNNALVGPEWDSGKTFNREHVWPKSLGGNKVESDMHMVMPASTSINSERGNSYYGNSLYDAGQYVAEYRGIAARIIFYCAIADTSLKVVDKNSGSNTEMGKLSDLLSWNLQYLPNSSSSASLAYKTEQYRNEIIDSNSSYGGNRNPFIDHPEYACRIWGDTNADTRSICGTSSTPSVTLNKTTVNLEPGASETITATINNGSGTISWTSSNENVATVSGGTITAKSTATVGQTAEITASVTISGTTYSKKCTVTIIASGGGSSSGDYSIVFKTGSDGSSEISYSNLLGQASSNTLVNNFSASSKCYAGASGLKLGSSSATGSFTATPVSAAQTNVKSITVNSVKYGTDTGTLTLKVNGNNAATGITPGNSYTYTFSSASSVTSFGIQTSSKRAYVASVSFTLEGSTTTKTLTSISLNTDNVTKTFTVGDTFSYSGLVVTAHYNGASDAIVTPTSVSSPDMTTSGEKTITVSYTEGGVTKSATYKITVNESSGGGETTASTYTSNGDYVKVTSSSDLTDGEYLIVYEDGGVAFNGGLTTLDATSNTISVTISNSTIASNSTVNAATFTYDGSAGTLKSKSGYYIGQTANDNGLKSSTSTTYSNSITISSGNANIVSSNAYMRYNNNSGQYRFRYFKSSSYTNQKAIQLYKKTISWGSTFLSTVTCNGGSTAPSTANWSTMQTAYNSMTTAEQNKVKVATASESGTDLQKAIARYVFIVNKYTNRTNYPDYLSKASSSNRINPLGMNDSSTLLVVIATATCLIGMTFIALSIKKRKEK